MTDDPATRRAHTDAAPPEIAPAAEAVAAAAAERRGELPEMRYQTGYVWFVFVASLDIMLTWLILRKGGEEVNPIARLVIDAWGLTGAILFKFALTVFVIVVCDVVGRTRDRVGRTLIVVAILVSSFPVFWSITLLTLHALATKPGP